MDGLTFIYLLILQVVCIFISFFLGFFMKKEEKKELSNKLNKIFKKSSAKVIDELTIEDELREKELEGLTEEQKKSIKIWR